VSALVISEFRHERDTTPERVTLTWESLTTGLRDQLRRTPCTVATCIGSDCEHKPGPAWSPAVYPDGATRADDNVVSLSVLVLDLDHVADAEFPSIEPKLAGYAYALHASHSDRPGDRCVRAVVSLTRPVPVAEWRRFWRAAVAKLGLRVDGHRKDLSGIYYLPSRPSDAPYYFTTGDGVALDVDQILASAPAEPTPRATVAAFEPDEFPPPSNELIAHVRDRLEHHGPARAHQPHPPDGCGGNEHTRRAWGIVSNDYALPDDIARELIEEWNAKCDPPWDLDPNASPKEGLYTGPARDGQTWNGDRGAARVAWEAEQRIKRALDRALGGSSPSSATTNTPREQPTTATALDEFACEPEPEPEPGTDAAEYAQALRQVQSYWRDHTEQRKASEFKRSFKNARDKFATPTTAPRYLIKRLLLDGGTAMISGEPKSAKTWLAIECAIGVATGTYAIDPKYTATQGNVAYFFTEDLDDAIKTRVAAVLRGRGLTESAVADRLFWEPRGDRIDIMRDDDCARIIASARLIERDHGKLALLSIDPLRNIHMRDEDKSGEMAEVFERLKMIEKILGCTAMLVHHAKKAGNGGSKRGGQKMRGSSAMHGFLDSAMYLDDVHVNDEGNVFTNNFESELKAARSAGKFKLTLTIEDDAFTETARSVTWSIDGKSAAAESTTKPIAEEQVLADLRLVVDVVRKIEERGDNPPSKTDLRTMVVGVPDNPRCRNAIGYGIAKGYLKSGQQGDRSKHTNRMLPGERITIGEPLPEPTSKRRKAIKTTEIES